MNKLPVFLFIFISTTVFCQKTRQFADSLRTANNIPELAYAVITDRQVLETAALGLHSIELPDTATPDDRFHIGSMTKAMTAFIIARYVEKGKLRWDTRFFDLFPEWQPASRPEYANITLQDLLSHRAMIQPFQGNHDPEIPPFTGNKQEKRAAFGKFVLTLDPVKKDSVHIFTYSNADYTLATLMLERVSKHSWEELIDRIFNRKLHLNVRLSWPENQQHPGTWGHLSENGKLSPVPSNFEYRLEYTEPAGDINIRLKDYIRFIQMNISGLEGHNNYLKASTYRFLHTGLPEYAIGWYNIYENGGSISSHSGTAGTYYSLVHIDRKKGLGYIIFTNAFSEETVNGVRMLMRELKAEYSQ